jgi:hypothetical protein
MIMITKTFNDLFWMLEKAQRLTGGRERKCPENRKKKRDRRSGYIGPGSHHFLAPAQNGLP